MGGRVMKHQELITKWVAAIGLGFDPLLWAKDYTPPFTEAEAAEYDADTCLLWLAYGDTGDLEAAILDEMKAQRLI